MKKLPISAMVVGYNEAHLLARCLSSISFCEEIVYTDLGSSDESIEVAKKYASTILQRERVPSCEMIQAEVVNYLKNDWVIFIDPDECVDELLAGEIIKSFTTFAKSQDIGGVMVPWQFYFKRHKLRGTPWGGMNKKYLLVHRNRFTFEPIVHYGRKLRSGFDSVEISYSGDNNVLHHYWMNSNIVFIKKHLRYLKHEAKDQYALGYRLSAMTFLKTPHREFRYAYVERQGRLDGFIGLSLSLFWALYKTIIAAEVLWIQVEKKRSGE